MINNQSVVYLTMLYATICLVFHWNYGKNDKISAWNNLKSGRNILGMLVSVAYDTDLGGLSKDTETDRLKLS